MFIYFGDTWVFGGYDWEFYWLIRGRRNMASPASFWLFLHRMFKREGSLQTTCP